MKNFCAVICLLTFATITMAADSSKYSVYQRCVSLNENNFDDYILSYLFRRMKNEVEQLLKDSGLVSFTFSQLSPQEAEQIGYQYEIDLCGSDEAIATAHHELYKLARTLVHTATSTTISRPRWEFLRMMQTQFDTDGGSVKISLLPSRANHVIQVHIVTPRKQKDLADFIVKGINENFCEYSVAYQANQSNKITAFVNQFIKSIVADNVCFVIDRQNQFVYVVGIGEACQKWRDQFNRYFKN